MRSVEVHQVGDNDRAFTELFAVFTRARTPSAPAPGRAFALTSAHVIVYAYPALPGLPERPDGPAHLIAGHMVGPDAPPTGMADYVAAKAALAAGLTAVRRERRRTGASVLDIRLLTCSWVPPRAGSWENRRICRAD
ncbi:hypothetical protein ACIGAN_06320 [Streptomyces sp. NPDC085931]|uniref:hypothetical protein n=1 Tax=Streptomyces sp. NPDC085931 TaxID=3365740 RepID=UPI0037D4D447